MSNKKRWQPNDAPGDGDGAARTTNRAETAAGAMSEVNAAMRHAEGAMRQARTALAAQGVRGGADFGLTNAAMHETERQVRKAMDHAQAEVDKAMERANRSEKRATRAEEGAE